MLKILQKISLLVFFYTGIVNFFFQSNLFAQAGCGSAVPTFTVNLAGNPNGSWISPDTIRDDNCCGTSNPDRCIQFIITLDTAAQGILFNINSGAIPSGAMYYQINCSPPVDVGNAICLSGPGPHYLTFCKPGANKNTYIITSIGSTSAEGDSVTTNCNSGMLVANNFYEPSVTWTSIFPGSTGAYNSYLNCTSGCDTVFANPLIGAPPYIDYLICGKISTLCDTTIVCDTARVYVYTPIQLSAPGNICTGTATASITATPNGGVPPYTYQWNPTGQTTQTATGLSAGSYTVNLTDANGCSSTATITIYAVGNPVTTITPSDVSCFGGSDGSASVSVSGGTPAYTYLWNSGQTSTSIIGLIAGSYSVTTTDVNGCTTLSTISITQPPVLTSTVSQSNISCFGGNNGSGSVLSSGGTPGYSYLWNNGKTGLSVTGLTAGNYSVTTTDANGCTATSFISITQPPAAITFSISKNNISCFGNNNGSVSVSASGGTPGYTYLWSNGKTTSSVTGLAAGIFSITTTDANGCTEMTSATVTQPPALFSTATQTNVCSSSSNGTAIVSVTGGAPAYTYSWSSGQTAQIATGLSAGNYSVLTTDVNGCTIFASVNITLFPALTSTISKNDVSCNAGSNGSATVIAGGGASPYTYSWNTGITGITASNLTVGNYAITITDKNSCTMTTSVTINQPTPISLTLSTTPSTCNQSNGSATVTASGGAGAYSYFWNNGQTTSTANSLASANYLVTVTDANGCTKVDNIQVYNNPGVTALALSSINVACTGICTGSATVGGTGGALPYTYLWMTGATTTTLNNLCAGTYTVMVTDSIGCTSSTAFYITQPSLLSATCVSGNVSCFGYNNGSAVAGVSGGISPYTYNWNTGATTSSINALTMGTYSVTVSDNNGCTSSATVTITEPPPVSIVTNNKKDITCFGSSDGSISVTASGGTPSYNYYWSPNIGSSSSVSNLPIGNYQLIILDQNGCKDSVQFILTQPSALNTSTVSITPPSCYGGNNGTAGITVTGGTSPYRYTWSTIPVQTGATASNLSKGNYTVHVEDANNCIDSLSINLTEPTPVITTAGTGDTICGGQLATISASASGGVGGYVYSWSPSITGNGSIQIVSPTASTIYTVTAYDQNNCSASSDTVLINVINLIPGNINMYATTPICPGQSSRIYVTVSGNPGPLTYSWNNGLGNSAGTYTVTPSQPTTYAVTITNSCGTVIMDSIKVDFNPPPIISISTDTLSGCTPVTINFSDLSLTGNISDSISSWLWNFGDGTTSAIQNPSHIFTTPGTYSVTLSVRTTQGCQNSNSGNPVLITVHPIPQALFSVNSTNLLLPLDSLKCNNQSIGAINYYWSFGDGYTSNQINPAHSYNTPGNYHVQLIATNAFTCSDTAYIDVTATATIVFPSGFTPDPNNNSNGYYDPNSLDNNIFFPYTSGVVEYELLIFDRWGELIFETHDIKQGWNGYFNDKICQQDVYIYKAYVKFFNGKVYKKTADVTLIR